MQTNQSVNENLINDFSKENPNPKDFLNALQKLKNTPNYQTLRFALHSLCDVLKTALTAKDEYKQLLCYHTQLGIYSKTP